VFDRIIATAGGLDLLVNSAWGGYEGMVENGVFTWSVPFWQQPLSRWTGMIDAAFAPHSSAPPTLTLADV
jgi:dehydrogenase/reductase SDR family member 1